VILLTPTLSFREGVVIITLSEGEGEKGGEEIKSFNKPQGRRRQVVLLKT